jgi:hypothetical protein
MADIALDSSTAGGHMLRIEHTTDFEFYSSTSQGAIQGYGYVFHKGQLSFVVPIQNGDY